MISRLMQYGGIAAKVRAMYGRRLNRTDYEKLIHAKSISDIAAYLKSLPAWSDALKSIQPSSVHRAELEQALRRGINDEYERIYKFIARDDKPLLRYIIRQKELDEIFRFLRSLVTGRLPEYICTIPAFFKEHSRIRFERFDKCRNFDDFLDCIKDSIYYKPLADLPRKQGDPPDYTLAKAVLSSSYYSEVLDLIKKNYSGDIALALKNGIGTQIDLINIETIIRIKTFFPEMSASAFQYLIPYNHLLKQSFIRSLTDASTADEAYELLKTSPYVKLFSAHHFQNPEDYQRQYLYDFYKKLLSAPVPSVFTPIAYLSLKEIEVNNIVNIVECVRYGETPASASVFIAGM